MVESLQLMVLAGRAPLGHQFIALSYDSCLMLSFYFFYNQGPKAIPQSQEYHIDFNLFSGLKEHALCLF